MHPTRLPASWNEQQLGSLHLLCAEPMAGLSSQYHLRQLSKSLYNWLFSSGVLLLTQELMATLTDNLSQVRHDNWKLTTCQYFSLKIQHLQTIFPHKIKEYSDHMYQMLATLGEDTGREYLL